MEEKDLNPRQELFCRLYTSADYFGNGIEAYIEAYKLDTSKDNHRNTAKSNAHRLLKMSAIVSRIDELLEDMYLNDQFVDKEIAFLIAQKVNLNAKIRAIEIYNKMKKRYDKNQYTEESLPIPILSVLESSVDKTKNSS